MSLSGNIISEVIENDVKIITYKDGSQSFESLHPKKTTIQVDNRSWWQKIKDWWNDTPIKPYVKIRDLADPLNNREDDINAGSDGKNNIEVGIKIDF